MSLNLTPNKTVGYRIKPDWYSFNVVLVKLHGDGSKNAGKEYETPLAYCKHLGSAAQWIFSHSLRVRGAQAQDELEATEGSCSDIRGLLSAVEGAQAAVLAAVAELQGRIDSLALSQKDLVKALGSAPEETEVA